MNLVSLPIDGQQRAALDERSFVGRNPAVCTENLSSSVVVMKSAQHRQ
jgi:hypothetical protein